MYKFAAQNAIRFNSTRGAITVEQLFQMPLKAANGFDLDSVARAVNNELKSISEESFVEETASSPRRKELEVSLEIVKDVIKTKQDENQAKANRIKKAAERKKILDALATKQDQALSAASIEDLEKKLAALEE